MAEDDDDDTFGDFTFAPSSYSKSSSSIQFNQQQSSTRVSWPKSTIANDQGKLKEQHHQDQEEDDDDDDEWGDFVETSLGSANNLSKAFEPLNFFASNPSSQSQLQSESTNATQVESGLPRSESEKRNTQQWAKLKGAIPLSVFGDAEGEEEGERIEVKSPGVDDLQDNNSGKVSGTSVISSNYNVNNGSKCNAYVGSGMSYDVIANLYSNNQQQVNFANGLRSSKSFDDGLSSNAHSVKLSKKEPTLELNGLNLDLSSSALKKVDSDTVMDSDNQSHKSNIRDGARSNGTISSNLDAFQMDFGEWNININRLNMKSDMDAIGSISNQSQLSKAKTGSSSTNLNDLELDLTEKKSSNFGDWNVDFDGFTPNSSGMDLNFQVSNSNANSDHGDENEEVGWEFKDAYSESNVTNGNEKVQSEEHIVLEENRNSQAFVNDFNGASEVFPMSSGPFDLFSISNDISGSFHNTAAGKDSKSSLAAQNGLSSGKDLKEQTKSNGDLESPVESAIYQEDFGQFVAAFEETGPREEAERSLHDSAEMNSSSSQFSYFLDGSADFFASNGSIDLFSPVNGNSKELTEIDFKVDAAPSTAPKVQAAHSDCSFKTQSISENINDQGVPDSHLVFAEAEFDDDFGEFTAASAESAHVPEEIEIRAENHMGPLPLSIFGVEEQESDGSFQIQDVFLPQSASFKRDNCSSNSPISINELLSHLYSQDEQISSVDSEHKPIQNGSAPTGVVLSSSVGKDTDDFDDTSCEFADTFSEVDTENGTCLHNSGDANSSNSTQLKLNRYVDFYSKLLDELHFLAKCHLESLKEAQTTTSNQDEELATLIEEIQQAFSESSPNNAIPEEPLGDYTRRESHICALIENLKESELQILESEYSLQTKLSLVDKDSRLTMQLIKHAETTLKILSLGSLEEQLTYVSIWSKMISVCVEELKYGAQLWRQAFEKNVQRQILTDPQGKRSLLALGEIYRVAIIIEASIKLYKPWMLLSSVESPTMYCLLDECHTLWCSSGLEEALLTISVSNSLDGDNSVSLLVDAIKYSHDLDAVALENQVFVQGELLCRLSLLSSSVVPGVKFVEWGGEQCFVKLANLWANLISNDIPKLPSFCVNC